MTADIQITKRLRELTASRALGAYLAFVLVVAGTGLGGVLISRVSYAYARYAAVMLVLPLLLVVLAYVLTGSQLRILVLALLVRATLYAFSDYEGFGGESISALVSTAVLAICVFLLMLKGKHRAVFQVRSLPYALFIIFGAFGALAHPEVVDSKLGWLTETARLLSNLAILWMIVAFVRNGDDVRRILAAMVWSSIVPLLAGFLSFASGNGTIAIRGVPGLGRVGGVFVHPNIFGHYLLIIFFTTLVYGSFVKKRALRIGLTILQAALLSSLVLTFSRSSMIGFGLAFTLFVLRDRRKIPLALVFLALFGLALYRLFPDFVNYTLNTTLVSDDVNASTFASRALVREIGLSLFTAQWAIGWGPGSFIKLADVAAHNDYVRVLVEYGVIGLPLYLATAAMQLRDGWRLMRGSDSGRDVPTRKLTPSVVTSAQASTLAYSFLSLDVGLLVMSFAANIFNNPVLQWYVFALWGLVIASRQIRDNQ